MKEDETMRIWLDDVRPMPKGFDHHCKDAQSCMDLIDTGVVTFISFDYDLGENSATGYAVACHIASLAYNDLIGEIQYEVHSMNPVGDENIKRVMRNANEYWYNNSKKKKYTNFDRSKW